MPVTWPAFCNYILHTTLSPSSNTGTSFISIAVAMSDFEFLSLEFEFEGAKYYSLIRKKKKVNGFEYGITVMNGKLEKLLFGNHIIKQENGTLHADCLSTDKKLVELKQSITNALQKYLASHSSEATAK
jgi:hypothetical protein